MTPVVSKRARVAQQEHAALGRFADVLTEFNKKKE